MNIYKTISQALMLAAGFLYAGVIVGGNLDPEDLKDMGRYTRIHVDNKTGEDIWYAFKATDKSGKLTPFDIEGNRKFRYEPLAASSNVTVSRTDFPALVITNKKGVYATLFVSNDKNAIDNVLANLAGAHSKKLVTSKLVPLLKNKCKS